MKPSRVHQKCSDSSGPPQPPSGCGSTHSAATVFSTSTSRHLLLSSPSSQKGDLVSPPCSLTSWHLLPFLHLDRWRHTYMCVCMYLRGWREQRTQWGRQRTWRESQLLGSTQLNYWRGWFDHFDLIWAQEAGPQSRKIADWSQLCFNIHAADALPVWHTHWTVGSNRLDGEKCKCDSNQRLKVAAFSESSPIQCHLTRRSGSNYFLTCKE